MCTGRVDLHSCGCFDEIKTYPCRDSSVDKCNGIGALITNHVNRFCRNCTERKKQNLARLNQFIAESRIPAHITTHDDNTSSAPSLRTIDADDLRYQTMPAGSSLKKSAGAPSLSGPQDEMDKKDGVEHNVSESDLDDAGERVQPKITSSKFVNIFSGCFGGQ